MSRTPALAEAIAEPKLADYPLIMKAHHEVAALRDWLMEAEVQPNPDKEFRTLVSTARKELKRALRDLNRLCIKHGWGLEMRRTLGLVE